MRNTSWSAFVRTFLASFGSSPPPSFAANSTWCLCLNVFPVAPTVLAQSRQGPICGLHKPSPFDSDDDTDPVILPPRHSTVPAPSLVVTQPPAYEQPTVPQPVHDVVPVQELPPVPAVIVPPPCTPASSPDCSVLSGAPPESAVVVPPRKSGRQ